MAIKSQSKRLRKHAVPVIIVSALLFVLSSAMVSPSNMADSPGESVLAKALVTRTLIVRPSNAAGSVLGGANQVGHPTQLSSDFQSPGLP